MKVLLGGVLVVSLAANVYLLATRGDSVSTPSSPETRIVGNAREPRAGRPPPPPALPHTVADAPYPEYRDLDRAELERRLAEAEADIARLLPAPERFERAERSPENEQRVKPFLDKVFKGVSQLENPYAVECHARICKLTVLDKGLDRGDWMGPLQSDVDGQGMFAKMQFGGTTFLELEEPGRTAGLQALMKLLVQLQRSPAVATCKTQHPTPGAVTFTFSIEAGRFVAPASGPLANQAAGICLRRVVEDAIAAVRLPAHATLGTEAPLTFQVP